MKGDGKVRPEVSRWEGYFLSVSNLLIVTIVIIDLFQLSGIAQLDLPYLTLVNLVILTLAFFSYRIKRRINVKAMETKKASKKSS